MATTTRQQYDEAKLSFRIKGQKRTPEGKYTRDYDVEGVLFSREGMYGTFHSGYIRVLRPVQVGERIPISLVEPRHEE